MKFGAVPTLNKRSETLIFIPVFIIYLLMVLGSDSGTLCFFKTITGLPCPGCGITQSTLALLRGDVVASFKIYPCLGLVALALLIWIFRKLKWVTPIYQNQIFWIISLSLIMFTYTFRMISTFPSDTHPMTFSTHSVIYNLYTFIVNLIPSQL